MRRTWRILRGHRPKIYPVINVAAQLVVLEEATTILSTGADGIFLIDHDADDTRLATAIRTVREEFPKAFLGANFVRRDPSAALHVLHERLPDKNVLDALWTDNSGVTPSGVTREVMRFAIARDHFGWTGHHFGGVAFKYQEPVLNADLPALGVAARAHVDVPTTSGSGTGQPIDRQRLRSLREGLGDHPLALASGVTPENIGDVVGLVDFILVSSGIAAPATGRVDPARLAALQSHCAP